MIVTIDGPAGAGKSTVTRKLAQQIGFQYLDTGAMYRAVTWQAIQNGVDLDDEIALQQIAVNLILVFDSERVLIDDQDCLLYTSPSPRDATLSRMPSSA